MSVKYRIRDQVILENVCGQNLLLTYGGALEQMPYLRMINDTGAYYWKLIEAGHDVNQILDIASEEFEIPRETIKKGLYAYLTSLTEAGYLLEDDSAELQNHFEE